MCSTYPEGIDKTSALVVLILDIIFPGIGTIVAGLVGSSYQWETVVIGILQLLLVPVLLIGWIWSIVWAINLYRKSRNQYGGGKVDMQNEQVQHNQQQQNYQHQQQQQQEYYASLPLTQIQKPPSIHAEQPAAYPSAPPPPVPSSSTTKPW